jgi:gluconate 5-dehydrogenase
MMSEAAGTTQASTVSAKQLFDLTGRVAIITGGSIGLGRQMAEGLGEMGAHVVLCARKEERCREAAEELQQLGVKAIALACDVKSPASIHQLVDAIVAEFGRIDVLINNAGISWGAPVEEMSLEDWNKVIETNLTGTFLCAQAVGKVMIRQGRGENSASKNSAGKIINIASVAGLGGAPPELPAIGYHASKGGVISFTKDLACKWASHNIQVNAIAPGWFPTHMSNRVLEYHQELFLSHIPLRRFGNEHDLKGAAVFLASAASNYVTGHVLVVDGGQSAW